MAVFLGDFRHDNINVDARQGFPPLDCDHRAIG
jgi:hypothetical protein